MQTQVSTRSNLDLERTGVPDAKFQGEQGYSNAELARALCVIERLKIEGAWYGSRAREGVADKAKGTIKEGAGKLSGDKDLQRQGRADKAKGAVHNAAGDVKDAARDAADAMKK